MKRSIYQIKKKEQLKKKARSLYRQGLTLRDIAKMIDMSHQWVANAINEKLSTLQE